MKGTYAAPSWGPDITPTLIRNLIFLTAGISLFSALTEPILRALYGLPGASYLFSLTWQGFQNYYLWQCVTYLFLQDTGGFGISLFFLIGLAFNMYLLWMMGSDLLERIGQPAFFRFYLFSGVFAAVVALITMYLTNQRQILSGPTTAILAVLTAWMLFNPENELLLFFLFPIKAKWLWVGLVSAFVLISLSHLDWISLSFYGSALLFGYFYAVTAWDRRSPFRWIRKIDQFFAAIGHKFHTLFRKIKHMGTRQPKVYDIKTGEPLLDDNHFVDVMLEKISKHGESSLSWKERERLQSISKNKQKRK